MLDTLTIRRTLRAPAHPIRVEGAALEQLDGWQPAFLAGAAAACVVSVVAAQLLLALACLAFLTRLAVGRVRMPRLALTAPVLSFAVWTLLAACFAADTVAAHEDAKSLVLFGVLWVAADSLSRDPARERIVDAVLLGGLVLALACLAEYYLLGFDTLDNRPRGLLGHYMTSSGLTMIMLVLAVARLLFGGLALARPTRRDGLCLAGLGVLQALVMGLFPSSTSSQIQRGLVAVLLSGCALGVVRRGWASAPGTRTLLSVLVIPLSAWSLLISQTRSAWLGAVAGLGVVILLWAPRALALIPVGGALVLAFGPQQVLDRLTVTDRSSLDRYYMIQAGIDIVADRPIFGVGPGQVEAMYPRYRWRDAPSAQAPHLHDNAVQIAAERGLPGLALWLWMVVVGLRDALRVERRGPGEGRWLATAALGAWTAVLAAGLFEYNFGDSEVRVLLLLLAAAPYAFAPGAGPATDGTSSGGEG